MSGLLTTKSLSLALADEIATLAIKACKNNGFKPISICVMDPAGHEIVTKRMDGCPVSEQSAYEQQPFSFFSVGDLIFMCLDM